MIALIIAPNWVVLPMLAEIPNVPVRDQKMSDESEKLPVQVPNR